MAAIDSLIRLLDRQQGDALVLARGKPPVLMKAGAKIPLSMPPLDATMMETFLAEVATPAELEILRTRGAVATAYPVEQPAFAVQIKTVAGEVSLHLARGAAGARLAAGSPAITPPPPPSPSPSPAATPSPPPRPLIREPLRAAPAGPLDLAGLLDRAFYDEGVSDLILSAGAVARLRTGGDLVDLQGPPIGDAEIATLFDPHLGHAQKHTLAASGSVDFALEIGGRRFRVNLFKQQGGLAAAVRPSARRAPTLDELQLPDALRTVASYPNGLVLVTGPTGSGKSTTLVALIEHLNAGRARHVITLEDPIEFRYQPQRSLIHQREVGTHVESFESGLRAALRENPDVIMLGEMRDRPTIAAALTAAATGHLVLSSLHAGSAAMAIERMIDVFPEHQQPQIRQQVAQTLRAVVTQVLVPTRTPPARLPAIELALVTPAIANQIRESKGHQIANQIHTSRDEGMIPLARSLATLVKSGQVALEAALAFAVDPQLLRDLIK